MRRTMMVVAAVVAIVSAPGGSAGAQVVNPPGMAAWDGYGCSATLCVGSHIVSRWDPDAVDPVAAFSVDAFMGGRIGLVSPISFELSFSDGTSRVLMTTLAPNRYGTLTDHFWFEAPASLTPTSMAATAYLLPPSWKLGDSLDGVPTTTFTLSGLPEVSAVPEPATLALLATGLLGLGGVAVRRRAR